MFRDWKSFRGAGGRVAAGRVPLVRKSPQGQVPLVGKSPQGRVRLVRK